LKERNHLLTENKYNTKGFEWSLKIQQLFYGILITIFVELNKNIGSKRDANSLWSQSWRKFLKGVNNYFENDLSLRLK
jgi:hypothetical protein